MTHMNYHRNEFDSTEPCKNTILWHFFAMNMWIVINVLKQYIDKQKNNIYKNKTLGMCVFGLLRPE